MTRDVSWTLLLAALLIASAVAGAIIRRRLHVLHRSSETINFLRDVTTLLVTFVALMLSLLLTSVLSAYDEAYRDRGQYASSLAQLDVCMRNYGPDLAEARTKRHLYTASVIASTWPREPPPEGITYPDLSGLPIVGEAPRLAEILNEVGLAVAAVAPADTLHRALALRCEENYRSAREARRAVIEDAHGSLSAPFAAIMTFWLMLVFLNFGLQAPGNPLAILVTAIGIVSVSSVVFVILDLDLPYDGLFGIPSTAMRQAFADMMR